MRLRVGKVVGGGWVRSTGVGWSGTMNEVRASTKSVCACCKHYTKPTQTSHSRTRDFSCVAQDLSYRVRIHSVSQNSHSSRAAQHVARAPLLYPSHLSTTSLSTCTPARPSTRPSTRLLLMSCSHGDASIHRMCLSVLWVKMHSSTGYEPKDLTEEDNSMLVKPMFFHRQGMTSTCGSAEQIRNMLA